MKFQDSSFNGLKVTVGTKSVTHVPTLNSCHVTTEPNHEQALLFAYAKTISADQLRSNDQHICFCYIIGQLHCVLNFKLKTCFFT